TDKRLGRSSPCTTTLPCLYTLLLCHCTRLGGVAHVYQLQGGLLHNSPIVYNVPPDPPVVIQDEIPSGQRERTQQPVRKDKNMSVNMYDRAQRESSKTINVPDLLVVAGQRELVPQLHQILCHAVNSVHAWHPRVIHSLRKKKKHKN